MLTRRWVVSFVAIHLIGGIPVCFNTWLYVPRTPPDLSLKYRASEALIHCLRKSSPHLILADGERAQQLQPLVKKITDVPIGEVGYSGPSFRAC